MDIVYAAFDVFPAPKGASVHIDAFTRALGGVGAVELATLAASAPEETAQPWLNGPRRSLLAGGRAHTAIAVRGANMLERALDFRAQFRRWWGDRRARVAHVRGPFEGYPIARRKGEACERFVLEVNGLPSIELKYHYPDVADDRELMRKLHAQEQRCIEAADLLITPSAVTAAELARRGADPSLVVVVPNGVDEQTFGYREPSAPLARPWRLFYAGTLTAWQGVHHAVEALALLRREPALSHGAELELCGLARKTQERELWKLAHALGVAEHLRITPPLSQHDLCARYHRADVALAPLPPNDRNLVQGCCPLKVLEAMASGVPLVASDLPVVRALVNDEQAVLVRPGSAKAIRDGVLRLRADPALGRRLARAARARIERELSWRHAGERLVAAYRERLL